MKQPFVKIKLELQFLSQSVKVWRSWRKLRKFLIDRDGCCAICGYKKKLEGHHILPRHLFPEYSLTEENIIILCDDCHFHLGHWCNYKNYNIGIRKLAEIATKIRLYGNNAILNI